MKTLAMAKLGFILNSLNHQFRIRIGDGRTAMLYLYQPTNVKGEASSKGLIDVCALPSPRKYTSWPKFDFIDYTGRKSRGYTSFFKILTDRNLISPGKLSQFVPDWRDVQPITERVEVNYGVYKPPIQLTTGMPDMKGRKIQLL